MLTTIMDKAQIIKLKTYYSIRYYAIYRIAAFICAITPLNHLWLKLRLKKH